MLHGLVRFLYPPTCWVCGDRAPERMPLVCPTCADELTHDPHPSCPRCSSTIGPYANVAAGCPACRGESFAFDRVFRLAPYEGRLRNVVLRMKSRAGEDLAEAIGALWAAELALSLRNVPIDAVVPVPLHWTRFGGAASTRARSWPTPSPRLCTSPASPASCAGSAVPAIRRASHPPSAG